MTGNELLQALFKMSAKDLELPVWRENDGGISAVRGVSLEFIYRQFDRLSDGPEKTIFIE